MPDPTPEDRREAEEIVREWMVPPSAGLVNSIATALAQRTEKVRQEGRDEARETMARPFECLKEELAEAKAKLAEKEADIANLSSVVLSSNPQGELYEAKKKIATLTAEVGRLREAGNGLYEQLLNVMANTTVSPNAITQPPSPTKVIKAWQDALSPPPAEAGA